MLLGALQVRLCQIKSTENSNPPPNTCFRLTFVISCFPSLEHSQTERIRLAHPSCPLSVVSFLIICIWMEQRRERPSVNHQPRNESTKLLLGVLVRDHRGLSSPRTWCKDVDFKHGQWVRTYWPIPNPIDSKLRDCIFQLCYV